MRRGEKEKGGGCDWTAGIPACNVAFFSDVELRRSQVARAFSCFALMQARMPGVQSLSPSPFLVSPLLPFSSTAAVESKCVIPRPSHV